MRAALHSRDQDPTDFTRILDWLCRVTGATCAALVDPEGETVDYGGRGEPFDIRILAAELRLLEARIAEARHLRATSELVIRARHKTFLLKAMPEGYALVLQLPRRASGASARALRLAVEWLCAEAGFEPPRQAGAGWRAIEVEESSGSSHRPEAVCVDGERQTILVLGRLAGDELAERETGFRVRLLSGQEGNLVREALGYWYLEEDC